MKTAVQIDLTFEQVLSVVKQLPKEQQVQLTKELEKEVIGDKLSRLLRSFRTNDLSLETINDEVELVRKGIYDREKS
ncbi:MAG: hypothetical protein IPN86_02910 [Saprospiraceae bacterium]|jgi:predicted DNA-binding protein YlxM (UPF0122 family)|nr:hypothetical protein [Saprospiraceae bacterium]